MAEEEGAVLWLLGSPKALFIRNRKKTGCCAGVGVERERSPNPGSFSFQSLGTSVLSFPVFPLKLSSLVPSEGSGRAGDCVSTMSCVFKGSVLSQMHGEEPSACELKDAFPVGPEFIWGLGLSCLEPTLAP